MITILKYLFLFVPTVLLGQTYYSSIIYPDSSGQLMYHADKENNYIPIIASDGIALELLRKEFPYLQTLQLPSYQIEYAKNGKNFKWKLLQNCPQMIEAVLEEKQTIKNGSRNTTSMVLFRTIDWGFLAKKFHRFL